jgi:hypothetical protein
MKLTRKNFVAWLREQKPGRRFKLWTGNEPLLEWVSTVTYIYPLMGFQWPKWVERFLLSQRYWQGDNPHRKTITAAQCIELLGEKP